MKLLIPNVTWSLRLSLTVLRGTSFWWPRAVEGRRRTVWRVFNNLALIYLVVIYIIVQTSELVCVFGDVSLMTRVCFILFTNLALMTKMMNIVWCRDSVHEMVDEIDRKLSAVEGEEEVALIKSTNKLTTWLLYVYVFLSYNSIYGWTFSVKRPDLPLPARYPFDHTKSPAYEISYFHQASALNVAALINISIDTLVTTLIAQLCCRFKLLALSLTKVCQDLTSTEKIMLSKEEEQIALSRLRDCIIEHQAILQKASQIQSNFSIPIFAQLTVSSFIFCVTAYQLAFERLSMVMLWSMVAYLTVMMMEVFMYCYHGNELSIQSAKIASAAYECGWYRCSPRLRRALLILMVRSARELTITAGGITTLSLATFMRIVKASYSFFTLLQTIQE